MSNSIGLHVLQLLNESNASLDSLTLVDDHAKKPTDELVNGNRRRHGLRKMHNSCVFSQENNTGKDSRWDKLVRCGSNSSMNSFLSSSGSIGKPSFNKNESSVSGQQNATWGNAPAKTEPPSTQPKIRSDLIGLSIPKRILSPPGKKNNNNNFETNNHGLRRSGFTRQTSDPNIVMRIPERKLSPGVLTTASTRTRNSSSSSSSTDDDDATTTTTTTRMVVGKPKVRISSQDIPSFSTIKKQLSAPELMSMGDIKKGKSLSSRRSTKKGSRSSRPSMRKQNSDPNLMDHDNGSYTNISSKSHRNRRRHSTKATDNNKDDNPFIVIKQTVLSGRRGGGTTTTGTGRKKSMEIVKNCIDMHDNNDHTDDDGEIEIDLPLGGNLNAALYRLTVVKEEDHAVACDDIPLLRSCRWSSNSLEDDAKNQRRSAVSSPNLLNAHQPPPLPKPSDSPSKYKNKNTNRLNNNLVPKPQNPFLVRPVMMKSPNEKPIMMQSHNDLFAKFKQPQYFPNSTHNNNNNNNMFMTGGMTRSSVGGLKPQNGSKLSSGTKAMLLRDMLG